MPAATRIRGPHDTFGILALIVLHEMRAEESPTFATFMASFNELRGDGAAVTVLLYDNTPEPIEPGPLPANVRYEAAGKNAGLAAAYSRGLRAAVEMGVPWLLLLDQDTVLPTDFLPSLFAQIREFNSNVDVAALVPVIRSGDVISPKKVTFRGLRSLPEGSYGIQKSEIMSINSGAAIRCQFLTSIGGFNCNYWLDYLDHWLFRRIYLEGKQTAIYNCILEHRLSVKDHRWGVGITRYRSIVRGESAFMTTYKPKRQIPFYVLRLLGRTAEMMLRGQTDVALLTIAVAAKIIAHPGRSLEGSDDGEHHGACR